MICEWLIVRRSDGYMCMCACVHVCVVDAGDTVVVMNGGGDGGVSREVGM